jgi:membrane protein
MAREATFPNAQSPKEFHWVDWKGIFQRVKAEMAEDEISIVAAGVAFYFFFSIFPILIAVVSIYGIIASPAEMEKHMEAVFTMLPPEGAQIIKDQLKGIVSKSTGTLGWSTALSILVSLWSASKASSALIAGFNIAYDERDGRGFIKANLMALAFTLGAALYFIAMVVSIAVLPVVFKFIGLDSLWKGIAEAVRWIFVLVASMTAMALANRYAPSRRSPKWKWVSVGSIVGTLLWLVFSFAFSYYVVNFGNYNETYGSIAGIIVLMFWLYITAYVLLLSAEINSEVEHQTRADSTVGKSKPMGRRGAIKADTLPNQRYLKE